MRASFAKVDGTPGCEGVKWAVKVSGPHALHMEGTTVEVQKRDGSTQTVKLVHRLITANGRDAWYTFEDLSKRNGAKARAYGRARKVTATGSAGLAVGSVGRKDEVLDEPVPGAQLVELLVRGRVLQDVAQVTEDVAGDPERQERRVLVVQDQITDAGKASLADADREPAQAGRQVQDASYVLVHELGFPVERVHELVERGINI